MAKKTRSSGAKQPARKKPAARAGKRSAAKKPAAGKVGSKKTVRKKPAAKKAPTKSRARTSRRASQVTDRVAEIQRVIDVMVKAGAVEVELEEKGQKLRVRLKEDVPVSMVPYPAAPPHAAPAPSIAATTDAPASDEFDDPSVHVFTSPMVGTFYRGASPEVDPFVEIGTIVSEDSTLCILEAMKVMNEIKAECSGEVIEARVQNGEPVEFGQPLFVIRLS